MLRFLKTIFYIILFITLLAAGTYVLYKDVLLEKAKTFIVKELSKSLDRPVDIASLTYMPFNSILLKDVQIWPKEASPDPAATISSIILTVNISSLVKEKELKVLADIKELNANGYSANCIMHIESSKADVYKNILDLSLINSLTLIDGNIKKDGFALTDIDGILDIDRMSISTGKSSLSYKNSSYYITFSKLSDYELGYDISISSGHFELDSTLIKEDETLAIRKLTGSIFDIEFAATGEIKNFLSDDAVCTISASAETRLESLDILPGSLGSFIKTHPVSGSLKSNLFLSGPLRGIGNLEATSTLSLKNVKTDSLEIDEFMGKFLLKNGIISASLLNGSLYNGTVTGNCDINILNKTFPFNLSLAFNDMNFNRLLSSIKNNSTSAYGTLSAKISLMGDITNDSTYNGSGFIMISDGDLGPIPILTPYLGKTYMIVKHLFPAMQKVSMENAYTDINIKERKIFTDNLTLWGESISITASGYMGFDGTLDFYVENQLLEQSSVTAAGWQENLQNVITGFGKFISKAYLKGTIKEPKWKFEYKNPFTKILPLL